MIYPAQNGAEETVEKATLFSNILPLRVLHGNKIAVFVANIYIQLFSHTNLCTCIMY
jgi:hypothetical protein